MLRSNSNFSHFNKIVRLVRFASVNILLRTWPLIRIHWNTKHLRSNTHIAEANGRVSWGAGFINIIIMLFNITHALHWNTLRLLFIVFIWFCVTLGFFRQTFCVCVFFLLLLLVVLSLGSVFFCYLPLWCVFMYICDCFVPDWWTIRKIPCVHSRVSIFSFYSSQPFPTGCMSNFYLVYSINK